MQTLLALHRALVTPNHYAEFRHSFWSYCPVHETWSRLSVACYTGRILQCFKERVHSETEELPMLLSLPQCGDLLRLYDCSRTLKLEFKCTLQIPPSKPPQIPALLQSLVWRSSRAVPKSRPSAPCLSSRLSTPKPDFALSHYTVTANSSKVLGKPVYTGTQHRQA